MPAPEIVGNEIRIRVKNPDLFVDGSYRIIDINKSQGIRAMIGKLKSEPQGGTVIHSCRFDKEKWAVERASEWVKEHENKTIDDVIFLNKNHMEDIDGDKKLIKYYRAKVLNVDKENKIVKAVDNGF